MNERKYVESVKIGSKWYVTAHYVNESDVIVYGPCSQDDAIGYVIRDNRTRYRFGQGYPNRTGGQWSQSTVQDLKPRP